MKWYLKVFRHYTDFSVRARRKEYWMFVLFNLIFSIIAIIIDGLMIESIYNLEVFIFTYLYSLAVLILALAVAVRRLHDVGKSGWMLLIGLIPIGGLIWLFFLFIKDSDQGTNKWGQNPKELAYKTKKASL